MIALSALHSSPRASAVVSVVETVAAAAAAAVSSCPLGPVVGEP